MREACAKCTEETNGLHGTSSVALYDTGKYCFRCGIFTPNARNFKKHDEEQIKQWGFPFDYTTKFPEEETKWLNQILGDEATWFEDKCHLGYSRYEGGIVVPLFFMGHYQGYLVKRLNRIPKVRLKSIVSDPLFTTTSRKVDTLVITEDVFSAIKISEFCPALSLLGCKLNEEKILKIKEICDKVIVWLDPDTAGIEASLRIKKSPLALYLPLFCINSKKDPKDHTYDEIEEYLNEPVRVGFTNFEDVFMQQTL